MAIPFYVYIYAWYYPFKIYLLTGEENKKCGSACIDPGQQKKS